MAKITLRLDERTTKNGAMQVRIRINHHSTSAFITTGVWVQPNNFLPATPNNPIAPSEPMCANKRERILSIVRLVEDTIYNLAEFHKEEFPTMTANDIREAVGVDSKPSVSRVQPVTICNRLPDFLDWFDKYGSSRASAGSRKNYASHWRLLYVYAQARGMRTILFKDVTYERLCDIKAWMRAEGKGESMRKNCESYMRAAYREAERQHIIGRADDPFLDYRIEPLADKDIDTLTAEQMRQLIELKIPAYYTGVQTARDLLVLCFYLCGPNVADMYEMPKAVGGEVAYVRQKIASRSQKAIRIRLEPEALAIIEKYQGKKHLLCFAERGFDFDTWRRRIIRQAETLNWMLGFDVGFALIRRTWASVAGSLDIADRVIDKSMGHKDATIKDKHYEDYDWSRTARANRRVMDYVLYNK